MFYLSEDALKINEAEHAAECADHEHGFFFRDRKVKYIFGKEHFAFLMHGESRDPCSPLEMSATTLVLSDEVSLPWDRNEQLERIGQSSR